MIHLILSRLNYYLAFFFYYYYFFIYIYFSLHLLLRYFSIIIKCTDGVVDSIEYEKTDKGCPGTLTDGICGVSGSEFDINKTTPSVYFYFYFYFLFTFFYIYKFK